MSKISLIIQREYYTRVKKKSFIVMTILGPILMASLMIVPIWLAKVSDEKKVVAVVDESGIFYNRLSYTSNLTFEYWIEDIGSAKEKFLKSGNYALLYLPKNVINVPQRILLYSKDQVSLNVRMYIENRIQEEVKTRKMAANGISQDMLNSLNTEVRISNITLDKDGQEKQGNAEIASVISYLGGILIYFFIFLFGAQVMRGVIEEKTSRIVEIIISSVRPFQLMMGKIVGVALVGLTQFLLWIFLTYAIVFVFQIAFPGQFDFSKTEQIVNTVDYTNTQTIENIEKSAKIQEMFQALGSINFAVLIGMFLFYFIGGYLLYAALFAAIGSAVDNEADTQQFMLPVSAPLIFAFIVGQTVIMNPHGPLAVWMSMIPFTSPVIMMFRIPFGVHWLELLASSALLVLGFVATTWFAAKIYRTGILMYGKKVNYKELWKWLFYKG